MEAVKAKHIRNYWKVKKQIEAFFAAREKEDSDRIAEYKALLGLVRAGRKNVTYRDGAACTESGLVCDIDRLEAYLAPPWRGKPRKDTLLAYKASMLKRLDAADRAPAFAGLKVKIEWVRSRTWGHNPVAECWVFGDGPSCSHTAHYGVGRASGCGYDKRSAAVQDGIGCPTVDRLVVEHEKAWECYAVDGKTDFPRLSVSGKGVETLRSLFYRYGERPPPPIPGFEWSWEEGKSWDCITVTPKRRKSHV